MKILITGSSGYVGNELVSLLSNTHEIIKYDIANNKDILNFEQLKEDMKGCDIVVHIAAVRGPYLGKDYPDYFNINCLGTFNVAQACLECDIKKLIFTSSTSFYGFEEGIPYKLPLSESNPILTQIKGKLKCDTSCISYSTSKVVAEQVLANYGITKKFQVIILRLGPIGPKRGETWRLEGISLNIDNALSAIKLSIDTNKELWYEFFTITDDVSNSDISKAKTILNYKPI
ncbi:MAG: NAD(P)-dependent oxidoreductase [Bacteroidales bacterium]|jgi:nucleoside-diphosphate-sugar epimerase|nr:NAD(P)-dependent oxidoreductase [Bacteroidales bacterium]MDG2081744.1 NAD(P)-dependent oxidoreductase [Bacteroidales bacterium]